MLPAAHVVHVVRDVRQSVFEALTNSQDGHTLAASWAAQNAAVKDWATTQGLGLARRYSIARYGRVCVVLSRPEGWQISQPRAQHMPLITCLPLLLEILQG